MQETHHDARHPSQHMPSMPAHAGHQVANRSVTRPQLTVIAILTLLALAAGVAIPANLVNLDLSAEEVGGVIMPPGMVMPNDTPAEAMVEMRAVLPHEVTHVVPIEARGDRLLVPTTTDGVKEFDLEVSIVEWSILDGQPMAAYAFNRQIPGPRLTVTEGDHLRINVTNGLAEGTTVHWHGLVLPNAMDGPAHITQEPIAPGDTFTYEFTAGQPGTYFYHSHKEPDRQQALGMYGALIVEPLDKSVNDEYEYEHELVIQLQEWLEREGYTYPAMSMEGGLPNFFTINGKSYPDTEPLRMKVGERVRIRFIGSHNNFIHPMHIHGGPFEIIETDGNPVPQGARLLKDTVNLGPGERYDVIWEALEPGKWLLHCHIPHHTTNDNVEVEGGGGLTMIIEVEE